MNHSNSGRKASRPSRLHPNLKSGAVVLPLLMLSSLSVHAADQGESSSSAEAAPANQLQEIVVTSTRREESLSKVPISVTALTQQDMDDRGIKDIADVVRFTPGITIDNSGTSNISIRGISSTGGAGTTGIYIDDTPIQMRALAFDPDEELPKAFDMDRIEVLRGPQGTLFGAGSEGGTVRYITTQPSLTKTSVYSRDEISYTQGGEANYEAGVAAGGPIIDGTLGARATVWFRRDGGWVDRVDPTAPNPQDAIVDSNVNHGQTLLVRLAAIWAMNSQWSMTPTIYYQDRQQHDFSSYWPIYSNPGSNDYISGAPTGRETPDRFYLPALKIQADFNKFQFISNTSFFHRQELSGYDGTLYNLGFYQTQPVCINPAALPVFAINNGDGSATPPCTLAPFTFPSGAAFPLLDGSGIHLPASVANYRSPATINNNQENINQELRLVSSDPSARFIWTTGLFFDSNRQMYLEQIHDPMLNDLTEALTGQPLATIFGIGYDPLFPTDSYFLQTHSRDQQLAAYGEGTFAFTDALKLTVGARVSHLQYTFNTQTGGPQLFGPTKTGTGGKTENAFTPKVNLDYQINPSDMVYATYARGFRPGGANNPVPYVACQQDFTNFDIAGAPATYDSDTVDSFEVGSKDNFGGSFRIASSVYYIIWRNIQQTVVPPICQISFIANLGQAVAKGADVQVEWAMTEAFEAELSGGFTEARYTKDSVLNPAGTAAPVAISGDAISGQSNSGTSGQPAPPFTASVGLEYKFNLAQHESFVRADYEYESGPRWKSPGQDPNSLQYDPANFPLAATTFVSLRSGMTFGAWSIEAFCDNLFDSHTLTNYDWSIAPGQYTTSGAPLGSRLETAYTFRPRTLGLSFICRK